MSVISNDHTDVGAYALGLLEDRDKAVFEAHLATCALCKAELSTLSPVADLLTGLEPVELPGDAEAARAPVDLLRRRAAASRRRARWQIAVGVTGQLHTATDPATGVTGTVGLVPKTWGTQVTLDLAHVRGPVECQLIAVSKTGEQKVVTGWFVPAPGDGVPGHPAHLLVQGGTAIELGNLARFEVRVVQGQTLVTIPV